MGLDDVLKASRLGFTLFLLNQRISNQDARCRLGARLRTTTSLVSLRLAVRLATWDEQVDTLPLAAVNWVS